MKQKRYVVKCYLESQRRWVNPYKDERTFLSEKVAEKRAAIFAEAVRTKVVAVFVRVK